MWKGKLLVLNVIHIYIQSRKEKMPIQGLLSFHKNIMCKPNVIKLCV